MLVRLVSFFVGNLLRIHPLWSRVVGSQRGGLALIGAQGVPGWTQLQ